MQQPTLRAGKAVAGWLNQLYAQGKPSLAGSTNFTRRESRRWLAQPTLRAGKARAGWRNQLYALGKPALAGATNFTHMESRRWLAQPTLRTWKAVAKQRGQKKQIDTLTLSERVHHCAVGGLIFSCQLFIVH